MEIQCGQRHFIDPAMDSDLTLFFTSRVTDRHRLKRGHHVEAHQLCSKEDTAVRLWSPHAYIKSSIKHSTSITYTCVYSILFKREDRR